MAQYLNCKQQSHQHGNAPNFLVDASRIPMTLAGHSMSKAGIEPA
jgi:hypothetical protein